MRIANNHGLSKQVSQGRAVFGSPGGEWVKPVDLFFLVTEHISLAERQVRNQRAEYPDRLRCLQLAASRLQKLYQHLADQSHSPPVYSCASFIFTK